MEDTKQARLTVKELSKKPAKPQPQPWKDPKTHSDLFELDLKRPKANVLSNAAYYRIHLLPRSYDERVVHPHEQGFKYPTFASQEFAEPTMKLQT